MKIPVKLPALPRGVKPLISWIALSIFGKFLNVGQRLNFFLPELVLAFDSESDGWRIKEIFAYIICFSIVCFCFLIFVAFDPFVVLIFLSLLLYLADCSSIKTFSTPGWVLGISENSCSWLWDCDGFAFVHSCCFSGLVSICFGISNPYAVQPSIQQRFANLSYSWWAKEGALFSQQGIAVQLWWLGIRSPNFLVALLTAPTYSVPIVNSCNYEWQIVHFAFIITLNYHYQIFKLSSLSPTKPKRSIESGHSSVAYLVTIIKLFGWEEICIINFD